MTTQQHDLVIEVIGRIVAITIMIVFLYFWLDYAKFLRIAPVAISGGIGIAIIRWSNRLRKL